MSSLATAWYCYHCCYCYCNYYNDYCYAHVDVLWCHCYTNNNKRQRRLLARNWFVRMLSVTPPTFPQRQVQQLYQLAATRGGNKCDVCIMPQKSVNVCAKKFLWRILVVPLEVARNHEMTRRTLASPSDRLNVLYTYI